MQVSHSAKCVQGCLNSSIVHTGSIVRFNSPNTRNSTLPTMSDQLVVILRLSDGYSGVAGGQQLYHCAPVCQPFILCVECILTNQITRTPSVTLGAAHRVRHVYKHQLGYIEAQDPFELLVVQDLPKDTFVPAAQLSFDHKDCVQPASVRRIPGRRLHELPGNINLRMVESSLEAVLRRVDEIACIMGDPARSHSLPQGLNDQRRREDIMTLNLLRVIDRTKRPLIVVQPTPSMGRKSDQTSIWEQGTVPRNGGRC